MKKLMLAVAVASLAAAPAASAAAIPPPPTDPAHVSLGPNGCPPPHEDPCDPVVGGPSVTIDKTYPGRLIAWAEGILP